MTDLWGLSNCKKIFCPQASPILGEFEASISHWAKANCTPRLPHCMGWKLSEVSWVWIGPILINSWRSEESSRKVKEITSPCATILFGPISLWIKSCYLPPQAAISMIYQCQRGGNQNGQWRTMLELSSQAGRGQRNICFHYHQNCELNEHFNSQSVHA